LKRRQGFNVEFVSDDVGVGEAGKLVDGLGRELAAEARIVRLLAATTLNRAEYEDIEGRIQSNEDVSDSERWRLARTQIERFYRHPLSQDLVEADDRGRLRARVARFEALEKHARTSDSRAQMPTGNVPEKYGLRTRFLRDERTARGLLYDLLAKTPIYDGCRFDTEKMFSLHDLSGFFHECQKLKPVIENALGLVVSTERKMAVKQLNGILGVVGLRASGANKFKAAGETVYQYCLDKDRLERIQDIAAQRQKHQAWPWIYEHYGWEYNSNED
jgi:hypothetical protein